MALTTGQAPDAVTTGQVVNSDLPAWYQSYTQGLAGSAAGLAADLNSQPLPQKQVAGFSPDTTDAFGLARQNVGSYAPLMQGAADSAASIVPQASKLIDYAQGSVGGPAQAWTDPGTVSKYMSPYTSQVVDNITRLGNNNFNNNIMPGLQFAALGSGNFGSTRNAEQLGHAAALNNDNIMGQASTALQAGYAGGAGIFNQDANREQQQGQVQANTALTGANATTSALQASTSALGGLAQTNSALQAGDVANLAKIGAAQQSQNQTTLDTGYANEVAARTDPWTQLNNAAGIVQNVKLPTVTTSAFSGPASLYNPSAVTGGLSAYNNFVNALTPAQAAAFKSLGINSPTV